MVSWTMLAFECGSERARESLMEWFEATHPVEFPTDRYSEFAEIETEDGETRGADYAWLDRYLYVTVMGDADHVVWKTTDHWERAAIAEFDGTTETVADGMFLDNTESEADDEVEAHPIEGPPEWAGNGLMYALAMDHQFRFRSYSAQSPTNQVTPHPDAFTVPTEFADDFEGFIEEMAEVTGVEPTADGRAFLENDPAQDGDYRYGETYGPVDDDADDGVDRASVHDVATGETEEYRDPADVQEALDDADGDRHDASLLQRLQSLLS